MCISYLKKACGDGGHFFNTTETVNVMIHLFVSIANHSIQNRISKTTLSRRPRVRIQLAEDDLFHTELKLLRNAQEYGANIVAGEMCRVRPFPVSFSSFFPCLRKLKDWAPSTCYCIPPTEPK